MPLWQRILRKKPEPVDPFLTPSIIEVRSKMPDRCPLVSQLATNEPGDVANSILFHAALMGLRMKPGESIKVHLTVYGYDLERRMTEAAWVQFFQFSSDVNYVDETSRSLTKGKLTVTYNFTTKT